MMKIENLDQVEFLVYVAIHAAYADMRLSDNEVHQIILKFGEDIFYRVKDLYESHSEYENLKTISTLKEKYYPGEQGTQLILNHMMETFNADGDYNRMEKTSYNFLSKFLH